MEPTSRDWARPLYERVLSGLPSGSTLLDLGCGPGELARLAVDRGLVVTGVDSDPSAVAAAAGRVPEAEFQVGDAHELDAPDGTVDTIAAVQLITHVADPLRVLREAARVVRPDGTVVVTVWGRESECDVRAFGEALAAYLPPRPPQAGPPPLTEPDRLRRIAGLAGLEVTAVDEVRCEFRYADDDALAGPVIDSGLGRMAARRAGPAGVRAAVLDGLARFRTRDGGYCLTNVFRVFTTRPTPG
jgi:SAM-dependent methyltransferase